MVVVLSVENKILFILPSSPKNSSLLFNLIYAASA